MDSTSTPCGSLCYEVIGYLEQHHPDALPAAYRAFLCFEPYAEDPQEYARATLFVPDACRQEVLDLLRTVRERAAEDAAGNATSLDAIMNARGRHGRRGLLPDDGRGRR